MMHGRNNGKKIMAVRIVKHAFEIVNLLTDENPIQQLVNAIINASPREDSTRIGSGKQQLKWAQCSVNSRYCMIRRCRASSSCRRFTDAPRESGDQNPMQ